MSNQYPIQPLIMDKQGIIRFKENSIVKYLLDKGSISQDQLSALPFSNEDRTQFYQLIGYSLSGWADLDCVRASIPQLNGYNNPKELAILEHLREIEKLYNELETTTPQDYYIENALSMLINAVQSRNNQE